MEEYGLERPTKSYPKCRLLPQFEKEALKPTLPAHDAADRPPRGRDKAAYKPEVQPAPHRQSNKNTKARGYTQACETYWKTEQDIQDRSTDHGGAPQRVTMITTPDTLNTNPAGPNTTDQTHLNCVVMQAGIEALTPPIIH